MSNRSSVFYYVARISETDEAEAVDLTSRVQTFSLVDREGGMDKLELTVDNRDLANFDDPLFEFGAKLRIAFGNGRAASPVRDMVVRKVTGGRTLTVNAVTRNGSLLDTKKRRRVFQNVTRSEVVSQIARENGFTQPDIEDTEERFPCISQSNLTDGQLLRKLASLQQFEFFIDFSGLHWHRRRVDQAPARRYIYYTDPAGGEIIDFNIENDITRRPARVTVKSRDPISKEDIEANASNNEDPEREVLASYAATVDGESGEVKREVVQETTVASNVQTQTDAEVEAKGKFRKAQQHAVKLTLNLRGDPSLIAKTVIEVEGMGSRVSGKYYVKEVRHTLDAAGGYDMEAKTITDGFQGGRGRGRGAAQGGTAGLTSAAQALRAASLSDLSVSVEGESGALQGNIGASGRLNAQASALADALDALSKRQGDQLAAGARQASSALSRLASNARKLGATGTAASASNAAALCKRLAENPDQVEQKGKKNTKEVNDSNVRAVESVNADGQKVTQYVNTGGREP